MIHQKFVHQDLNGNPWGIVTIEQMWEDKYILTPTRAAGPRGLFGT